MKIIGIDPGKAGAITAMNTANNEVISWDMPETERDVCELFKELAAGGYVKAMIERVWGMPGMGGTAMFTFGSGYGSVRMAMLAHGIGFDEVLPRTWQKFFGISAKEKTETSAQHKNKMKAKAQQLFPTLKVTLKNADALLICEYLRRTIV